MSPSRTVLGLVLAATAPPALAYATFNAAARSQLVPSASPFSASGLAAHSTGLVEEDLCPVAEVFEVSAAPRVLPKRAAPGEGKDEFGLWSPPGGPGGPRGPSVFTLNQGRAIDMLRNDYPRLFTHKPDFSIFTRDVELRDPSGKGLRGLKQYEKVFDMLRFLRRTTMQDAQVTYRLVVTDGRIRIRWTAKLWMRDPALGLTNLVTGEPAVVHLDGVSNYDLDDEGKIYRHSLENIILRGTEQEAPVSLALAWPSLGLATPELAMPAPFFRPLDAAKNWAPPSGLAALIAPAEQPPRPSAGAHAATPPPQQHIAAQAAKRRGGEPQASVVPPAGETPMQRAARERAEDAEKSQRLQALRTPKEEAKGGAFGLSMPQPCETSYDCERPDVCCDLLFASVCCSGGMMIPTTDGGAQGALQRQAIPIPVEADQPGIPNIPRPPNNMPPGF